MVSMVVFVVIYATTETKKTRENQITHYEDTTITMGLVTENYLGYIFVEIPAERTFSPEELGVKDSMFKKIL